MEGRMEGSGKGSRQLATLILPISLLSFGAYYCLGGLQRALERPDLTDTGRRMATVTSWEYSETRVVSRRRGVRCECMYSEMVCRAKARVRVPGAS